MDCIFCKIVKEELPYSKVYEDEDFLAFMDIKPINKGHVLVIPKKHFELVSEMDKTNISKMIVVAEKINSAIRKSEIRCKGINFFLADGKAAGQEVPHVHLHVIPRFLGDGFGFKFPDNYENKPPRKELERLAEKIKRKLD